VLCNTFCTSISIVSTNVFDTNIEKVSIYRGATIPPNIATIPVTILCCWIALQLRTTAHCATATKKARHYEPVKHTVNIIIFLSDGRAIQTLRGMGKLPPSRQACAPRFNNFWYRSSITILDTWNGIVIVDLISGIAPTTVLRIIT